MTNDWANEKYATVFNKATPTPTFKLNTTNQIPSPKKCAVLKTHLNATESDLPQVVIPTNFFWGDVDGVN